MNTRRNIGSDGKLYSTTDNRDYGKYRVMNDNELRYELQQSMEIKAAMLSTGRLSDSRSRRPNSLSKSASFSAPMFGTASRSKKIETRAWKEKAANTSRGIEYKGNTYSDAMSKLKSNSNRSASSPDSFYDERRGNKIGTDKYAAPRSSGGEILRTSDGNVRSNGDNMSVTERNMRGANLNQAEQRGRNVRSDSPVLRNRNYSSNDDSDLDVKIEKVNKTPLTSVMNALKLKYEQNLDVIEKLFDEKKSMEQLVLSLDHQLLTARRELASPRFALAAREEDVSSFTAPSSSSSYVLDGEYGDDGENPRSFSNIPKKSNLEHNEDRNDAEGYRSGARNSYSRQMDKNEGRGGDRDRADEPDSQSSVMRRELRSDGSNHTYPRYDAEYDVNNEYEYRGREVSGPGADSGGEGRRGVAYRDYEHSESPLKGSRGNNSANGVVRVGEGGSKTQISSSSSYRTTQRKNIGNSADREGDTDRGRYDLETSSAFSASPRYGTSPLRANTSSSNSYSNNSSNNNNNNNNRPKSATSTSPYSVDRGRVRDRSRGSDGGSGRESNWPIDGRRSMSRSLSFDTHRISANLQADQDR